MVGDVAGQVDVLETVAIEAHGIDEVGQTARPVRRQGRRTHLRTAGRLAEKRDGGDDRHCPNAFVHQIPGSMLAAATPRTEYTRIC